MRCDYLMATLNPDDPGLDVYKEYINCSRPLPEWEDDTPQEIKDELREEQAITSQQLDATYSRMNELANAKAQLESEIADLDSSLVSVMVSIDTLKGDIDNKVAILDQKTEAYKVLWPLDQNILDNDSALEQTPGYE